MVDEKFTLDSYRDIAPHGVIDLLYRLAEKVQGKSLLHVNSTRFGGGVAEMLLRLVPLFNELGIQTKWDVITGTPLFYKTTKCFHNALQGNEQEITPDMYDEYKVVNEKIACELSFDTDVAVIHDPQPAAFINQKPEHSRWVWRCHIDISMPRRKVWNFLKEYVSRYDGAIFSLPSFAQKLPIPQYLIYPSIDPLSDKNRELSDEVINAVLAKYNIPDDNFAP